MTRRAPATPSQPPSNLNPTPTPPPPYDMSSRPRPAAQPHPPPISSEPTTYSSLSDLTKGKKGANAGASKFSWTPKAERAGYGSGFGGESEGVGGTSGSGAGIGGGGRMMAPPPSNYGREMPAEPPRRNVPASGVPSSATSSTANPPVAPSRYSAATNTASSYIPNSVSATASTAADRVKNGFDSVVNQQTKEQVLSGAGKAAAGAAKLAGKAAWSLGKFATGNK